MNKTISSKKNIIVAVLVVLVLVTGYFYFSGGTPSSDTGLLEVAQTSEATVVAARVLSLLNQIKSLNIDTSIFSDPAYQTLRDYSVVISPQNVGRANPFAPLSGASRSATSETSR